ncbi:MAG: sulfatase-like hydrolase/transferase [Planctomycetes bacterium]|nr:sulfatase-like hydrolase/transferase [Planctomycetota bacterium]
MPAKTNILIIITDQLSQRAVGAYGNGHVNTKAIDGIAQKGVRFKRAYTPYPLCCPARAAFWTGLLPHKTGVLSNGREFPITNVGENVETLGSIFSKAGYETVHFGKTHDAGTLRGFNCEPEKELPVEGSDCWPVNYDSRRDAYTVKRSTEYLGEKHDKPFVMVCDIQNPHDICNWIGNFRGAHDDVPVPGTLPPTLDNHHTDDMHTRPVPVRYICCAHNRQAQAAEWNEVNYRHYLAAYYHYVERADKDISTVLDALAGSDAADNTLVVFLADHGDSMGAHRLVTKHTSFYEETTHVPFVFSGPEIKGKNEELSPLVSLCDLLPTLCDYAGIEAPKGIYGKSLMPWLRGETPDEWREEVVSEWVSEWGFTIEPGRMLRTDRFKYTRYREGDGEELYDLEADPGEQRNLAGQPEYASELERHRALLDKHIRESEDDFYELPVKADECWRSHDTGYHRHSGLAAPEASQA